MDVDAWEERAAILEYECGLSRFDAETRAAEMQGASRYEFISEKRRRDSARSRDQREASKRDGKDGLSRVQSPPKEENGPVSERDVQAGRDCVDVPALRMGGR